MGEAKRRGARPRPSAYRRALGREVRSGVLVGLAFAAIYCAYALVLFAFRGPRPFEAHGVTLGAVLGTYVGGGLGAGALYGLLYPLRRSLAGQLVLGVLCATVVFAGILGATAGPPARWTPLDWQTAALCGTVMGIGAALALRRLG